MVIQPIPTIHKTGLYARPRPLMALIIATLCVCCATAAAMLIGSVFDNFMMEAHIELSKEAMHSVRDELNHELKNVSGVVKDWAVWDDLYKVVEEWKTTGNIDEDFFKKNLPNGWNKDTMIDCFAIVDENGKVIKDVPCGSSKPLPIHKFENTQDGFATVEDFPVAVVSHHIMSTDRTKTSMSVVVMSRATNNLKERFLLKISEHDDNKTETDGSGDRVILEYDGVSKAELFFPSYRKGKISVITVSTKRPVMTQSNYACLVLQISTIGMFGLLYLAIMVSMHIVRSNGRSVFPSFR